MNKDRNCESRYHGGAKDDKYEFIDDTHVLLYAG
jgi:hypothetical protein